MLEDGELQQNNFNSNEERTWGSSINLGGVDYATSLFWQSLQNQEDPQAEVIESSQGVMEGADLFCIKKGKTPQFGICASVEGYKAAMNVAAIGLATALSDQPSFVAVFKVSNGWWYVCVRDDVILANGDMLYLSEEDAKKQFMTMLMVPDWKLRIAPPEWGIDDTLYPDLEETMQRGAKVKLQKINTKGKVFYLAAGLGSVVVLWILYKILMALFDTTPTMPVIIPIQPRTIKTQELPPEPKPWESLPIAEDQMVQCYLKVMDLVKILPPGWKIDSINCSTGAASTSWTRQFGRVSIIDKALNVSGVNFAARSISDNGEVVLASVPFDKINKEPSEPTKTMMDLKINLNDLFQSLGQQIALSDNVYTSGQGNVYRSVNFKFQSNYNPVVWSEMLTKFSGLRINTIKYNTDTTVWEYEGAIYAL